jgi:hypothetical protein
VPVEGHLYGERTWFFDTRSPLRRMGVSAHETDATMVISLWQGDICTGTFRLPAQEAARLISTLAYGMTEAISGRGPTPEPEQRRISQIWSRFVSRLVSRAPAGTDSHLRLLK